MEYLLEMGVLPCHVVLKGWPSPRFMVGKRMHELSSPVFLRLGLQELMLPCIVEGARHCRKAKTSGNGPSSPAAEHGRASRASRRQVQ